MLAPLQRVRPGAGRLKTVAKLGLIISAFLFLSGCIEVLQYVGYDDRGNLELSLSFKVQKAMVEMVNEFSGEGEELDYEEEFGVPEDGVEEDYPQWAGLDYSIEEIDTELEYGFAISLSGQESNILDAEDSIPFLPKREGDVTTVELEGMSSGSENELAATFLSSAKYRIILSRNFAAQIEDAVYESAGRSVSLEVREFRDIYLVELPLVYVLANEHDGKIRITH